MKNLVIKYGVIYGIIAIILGALYIYGKVSMSLNFILSLLVLGVIFWMVGKEYKRSNNGFATLGELIKTYFVILVIGGAISMVSTMIQVNVISDETKESIVERQIQSQLDMYSSLGFDEVKIIEQEEILRESFTFESVFGFSSIVLSFVLGLFGFLIFALIGAAIFKKVPKEDIA